MVLKLHLVELRLTVPEAVKRQAAVDLGMARQHARLAQCSRFLISSELHLGSTFVLSPKF